MLNITNFFDHPTRPGYTVFRFKEKERAVYFRQLLEKEKIWFENDTQKEGEKTFYFFGVKNGNLKKVNQLNYLVNGRFRKPLIPNAYFRWILFIIAASVMGLALAGYLHQP